MKEDYIVLDNLDSLTYDFIQKGQRGECYRVGDKVFKKFINKPRFFVFLKQMSFMQSDSFVFPETFVYEGSYEPSNLKGYLMKYVEGRNIKDIDDVNISTFIKELDLLEKEIKLLTLQYKYLLRDIHDENMIYTDNNKFIIYDNDNNVFNPLDELAFQYKYNMDELRFMPSEDDVYNYKDNMKEIGNTILPIMLDKIVISDYIKKLYNMCIIDGKCKPSIVLAETLNELEKNNRIETVNEFKKTLKLYQ